MMRLVPRRPYIPHCVVIILFNSVQVNQLSWLSLSELVRYCMYALAQLVAYTAIRLDINKYVYPQISHLRTLYVGIVFQALFMIPTKPPPSFRNLNSKWSPEFIDFVAKCLVKNPEHRATAKELLQVRFHCKKHVTVIICRL